eukprot:gnl/Spiro4/12246_TR6461_c0_g1_i1.p1 gnl/Spiro4/12246_TR6461_c0_g1~~gnl/Spiro4/12246_TR6461_c0_g1_i1.p1  ORF type:complete len:373 (-),score=68.36 gnl/Spiro4/12246_TR6461_c0_g1_i1:87-1166(-)
MLPSVHGNNSVHLWRIAGVVSLYFFVSISLVFLNKFLMSDSADKDGLAAGTFQAPIFVTWFQCIVSVIACWLLGSLAHDAMPGSMLHSLQISTFEYKPSIGLKVLPLSIVFCLMITFNNLCLVYVEVSFYNVARSLTIVFSVVFSYLILSKNTSWKAIACLVIVIAGFFLGSISEMKFSVEGTLFGIISSVFVALNSIYTDKVRPAVNDDKWKLNGYMNVNASFLFVPLILYFESGVLLAHVNIITHSFTYWLKMLIGGLFGFAIGIVTVMQIQATSPLTNNISGTAKACVQTFLGFYFFRNPTNLQNICGIFMTLIGTMMYAYVRMVEMEAEKAKSAQPPPDTKPLTGLTDDLEDESN